MAGSVLGRARAGHLEGPPRFSKEHDAFLLELYRTRVANYNGQGQRLWTRFNYFLIVESAIFALHYYQKNAIAVYIGIVFSLGWYFVAAQDHYFFREHRVRIAELERDHIIPRLHLLKPIPNVDDDRVEGVKTSWLSFRTRRFTVTHFAVYAP